MKADAIQQLSILELASVDAELIRLAHRSTHLAEQRRLDGLLAEHREATDRLAVSGIVLEDLDGQVAKLEGEVDAVRQREDRDRELLGGTGTGPKQLVELQHELETLQRRQASLEDSLIELMERREQLQDARAAELRRVDELRDELTAATDTRDGALVELGQARHRGASRRDELVNGLNAELLSLYERQRAGGGTGAGLLQARRCGACRIEIDRGELARMAAAAEDEVLRCPECGAILVRTNESGL